MSGGGFQVIVFNKWRTYGTWMALGVTFALPSFAQDAPVADTPESSTPTVEAAPPVTESAPADGADESVGADDPNAAPEIDTDEADEAPPVVVPSRSRDRSTKVVGKTMEGSRASVQFQVETIIRSAYKVNGVAMEVDPD